MVVAYHGYLFFFVKNYEQANYLHCFFIVGTLRFCFFVEIVKYNNRWKPFVGDLNCDYTPCQIPSLNVLDGNIFSWKNTLHGWIENHKYPVRQAVAEITCSANTYAFQPFR